MFAYYGAVLCNWLNDLIVLNVALIVEWTMGLQVPVLCFAFVTIVEKVNKN